MASETNQKNPERSLERRKEEAHLKETLEVVRSNVETYGAEVFRMKGDIDEMLEHFHDNDALIVFSSMFILSSRSIQHLNSTI